MIASEAPLDDQIVRNYNKGMEYLLSDSTPVSPGGPVVLDPTTISWTITGTDNTDNPTGAGGSLIANTSPDPDLPIDEQVTIAVVFEVGGNTRNGDNVMLDINHGEYFARHTVTSNGVDGDLDIGHVLMTFPTVMFVSGGASVATYRIEAYIQDVAGNTSSRVVYDLNVNYTPYG